MRTPDDQWDITTGVGATALLVAAGRAMDSARDDRLVREPYAQAFVDAAGGLPAGDDVGGDADGGALVARQATYMGVRSRFFDGALGAAVRAGVRQVVLLAAGLDARAVRLGWPADVRVFEVDQPAVLEFKDGVIAERGAPEGASRVSVPVDLRHDWPAALRGAGFDPSVPTAWLAEGLLPYLPADAERLLFERVQELSAPGSRIAVEYFANADALARDPELRALGVRTMGIDVAELIFDEPRDERPDAWLRAHGWDVDAHPAGELAERYGRPLDGDLADVMGAVQLLRADLGAAAESPDAPAA